MVGSKKKFLDTARVSSAGGIIEATVYICHSVTSDNDKEEVTIFVRQRELSREKRRIAVRLRIFSLALSFTSDPQNLELLGRSTLDVRI